MSHGRLVDILSKNRIQMGKLPRIDIIEEPGESHLSNGPACFFSVGTIDFRVVKNVKVLTGETSLFRLFCAEKAGTNKFRRLPESPES